jgi:catechol 2,3-dioxygenase-like lactoylglutathione lyase family enzyme
VHRSRIGSSLVDCGGGDFEQSVTFWSGALGREALRGDDRYVPIKGRHGGEGGPTVLLQHDSPDPGHHLDFETDDVEAEVARLAGLGARVKRRSRGHVVMTAPSGHDFCVVPVFRKGFPAGAKEWD